MLRLIFILKNGNIIYQYQFGDSLEESYLYDLYNLIRSDIDDNIKHEEYFKYRISYIADSHLKLVFIFMTSFGIRIEDIERELNICKNEFLNFFGVVLDDSNLDIEEDKFNDFEPVLYKIHKNLKPKVSLIGFAGVGKTTIRKLIKAEEIPTEHTPTINVDSSTIKVGKLYYSLWDFAGQKQYHHLWNTLIKRSDAVLIITDSTKENVKKSKMFTDFIQKEAPFAEYAIIANKQDLEGALNPLEIKNVFGNGANVYPMIAIDQSNREKMFEIMADVLSINTEVSPLLKPLFARDALIDEAEKALKEGDLEMTMEKFQEISKLSFHLDDHDIAKMMEEKAKKIEHILTFIKAEEIYNEELQENDIKINENYDQHSREVETEHTQTKVHEIEIEEFIEEINKIKKTDEDKRKEIIIDLNKLNRPTKSKTEELRADIDRMIKEAEDLRKKLF